MNGLLVTAALLSLAVVLYIGAIVPLNGEDFALSGRTAGMDTWQRLGWVAARSAAQISGWNARLGEQLAIFWLAMPAGWLIAATGLAYIAFSYLLGNLCSTDAGALQRSLLAMALLFPLWPGLELFFWKTASAAYLQPLLLYLVCMRAYTSRAGLASLATSNGYAAGISLAALLAGLSFENAPVAVIPFMAASVWIDGKRFTTWRALLPVAAMATGWLVLVCAPSTQLRRAAYSNILHTGDLSWPYLLGRSSDVLHAFKHYTWLLASLAAIAAAWLLRRGPERTRLALLVAVALAIVASVVAAPYTEPRAFSLAWGILYAIVIRAAQVIMLRRNIGMVLAVVLLPIATYFALRAVHFNSEFARLANQRVALIEARAGTPTCQQGIVVPAIEQKFPYRYVNNRDSWLKGHPDFLEAYFGCRVEVR